jgi:hypothetical protein
MQESLLHYIWQFQYFDHADLQTSTGEPIHILNPGFRNSNAGPDFSDARIRIGDIEWIGSVEIHIHASGWKDHKHHTDLAYENVILHVVWNNDFDVPRQDGSNLLTLELKHRVTESLLQRYNKVVLNPDAIPCSESLTQVNDITKISMLEKTLMARLETKAFTVLKMNKANHGDWEETCYQLLFKNFGFKVNSEAFLTLSKALPYKILGKHSDKLLHIEALLFGQAGLLDDDFQDSYYQLLQREFNLLRRKFSLDGKKMSKVQWKFLRLRPANFPTLRIAELSSLLYQHKNIFSIFLEASNVAELKNILKVEQSEYWRTHYMFDRPHVNELPRLGEMSIDNIIINTVIPLFVAVGKSRDDQTLIDRAMSILENVAAEQNVITRKWNQLGIKCNGASDSQALIELYSNFCLRKRCLDCNIGSALIRPELQ